MGVGRIRAGSAGDPTKLKRELKESAGSDKWFMTIPADSEVTIRFLAEPWEFISYMKHYIGEGKDGKQFPCNEGDCIGCDEGSEPYKVWVAPVVEIEDGKPTRARCRARRTRAPGRSWIETGSSSAKVPARTTRSTSWTSKRASDVICQTSKRRTSWKCWNSNSMMRWNPT
jgi:hypothetical protein